MSHNWMGAAQKWLQEKANAAFAAWCQTKVGQEYVGTPDFVKRKMRRFRLTAPGIDAVSPYAWGFSLPDWHHNAIEALGKGDEETFKSIKLNNL
jgi:hypothetical protein